MDIQPDFHCTLDLGGLKPVVVEPSAGQISSDAGLLPFRQLDEQLGLTRQFAEALALDDQRQVANCTLVGSSLYLAAQRPHPGDPNDES